jgi:hypothetical protein
MRTEVEKSWLVGLPLLAYTVEECIRLIYCEKAAM